MLGGISHFSLLGGTSSIPRTLKEGPVKKDCESFARRTFPTPKIRTFTTPKNRTFARSTTATPNFFLFFRTFLGFFVLQLMEDIKDGREEVLDEMVIEHTK